VSRAPHEPSNAEAVLELKANDTLVENRALLVLPVSAKENAPVESAPVPSVLLVLTVEEPKMEADELDEVRA